MSSVGIVNTTLLCVSSVLDFRLEFLKPFHNLKNLENVGLRCASSEFRFGSDVKPTSILEQVLRLMVLLANRSEKVDSIS